MPLKDDGGFELGFELSRFSPSLTSIGEPLRVEGGASIGKIVAREKGDAFVIYGESSTGGFYGQFIDP
ncbi:hypothetical protein [Hansschlegelia zhihuaiae]|uniref:Uncharacterized protein n=1 Tax=Hansschlegelia zhihuaiae TaxID=405005 RepID=A0A4Q0MBW3_9HYPH|nr:hypothetical protein [Hansschlegelia zhihuaiae]RXF70807.1 hypothetical protein EK403_16645 [Hansschlegelia zhihuaiae]